MLLSVIGLIAVAANLVATSPMDWHQFKRLHGKSYEDPLEDSMRQQIFMRNKLEVERFNAEQSAQLGYERGLNHMSDFTEAEYKRLLGVRVPKGALNQRNTPESEAFLRAILADKSQVEDTVDWRTKKGIVTPVKDQGQCGSCWTFSAVGVLEGQELKHSNRSKLTGLSEQNLLDCARDDGDQGCYGGWPRFAIDQVHKNGGIESENTYPYTATDKGACKFDRKKAVMTVKGHANLNYADESQLKEVVAKYGPVSVSIDASHDGFQFYSSGIYIEANCSSSELNHAVLLTGYGTDQKGGDYWLVKNSWGESWGDKGYIRMARRRDNMCGIATAAVIPTF